MYQLKKIQKFNKKQILSKIQQTKIKGGDEGDSAEIIITDITEGI